MWWRKLLSTTTGEGSLDVPENNDGVGPYGHGGEKGDEENIAAKDAQEDEEFNAAVDGDT